jgi:putative membrane-bound dehydrogenase-like protein
MRTAFAILFLICVSPSVFAQYPSPKLSDPRLAVELIAAAPDIVHPIACDFDAKGRLLVIESHTHFAPKDYKGPKFDRIQMFDVSKKSKPTTFFEGTRHTMDLAVHPDGSVYLATRNEILRLRDTKGAGVADEKTRIMFLDTKGDYPHNGLSGLCFDSKGDLIFGMGENLGAPYTLVGADGVKFTGHGDGGHVFHCAADGKKLRRIATGFWNPFGTCRDIYGRIFTVDNDPDQAPPCRMLHVVEGGDYGFRFMYGRSGKHPFQSWHGTLPGTLPMMTGVGEAPCEIVSYESDGLPAEYRGQLLVTSWADHRVERYKVAPHGASFKAERLPFIQGGQDFRPVGLCVAPDGSLYFTDWVKRDYTLHGHGAIWHVSMKDDPSRERKRPVDPREAIFSMHRPLREAAAKELTSDSMGRKFLLRQAFDHKEPRVRAAALTALMDVNDKHVHLKMIAEDDSELGMREIAVRAMVAQNMDVGSFFDKRFPNSIRAIVVEGTKDQDRVTAAALENDPFMQHASVMGDRRRFLASFPSKETPRQIISGTHGFLVKRGAFPSYLLDIRPYLADPDETVRFLAVKWIADEKLADYRDDVVKAMRDPKLSVRMYMAYATALARLDGLEVNEKSLADYFVKRLADDTTLPAQRAMLLRQVPVSHGKLTVALLTKLLAQDDAGLKLEAVRALVEHPNPKKSGPLLDVFRNPGSSTSLRGFALVGLDGNFAPIRDELMAMAKDEKSLLRRDAMRALNGERGIEKDRPPAKDLDAWMKRLEGKADPDAGARIFAHPKLANCARCHRVDGRGADVGPDLSTIGNTDRRHLLESILQPSNTVAPHYVAWHLETADGKVRTGMLLDTNLDVYTYLDAKGERFKVITRDLVEQRPLSTSIMPDGLEATMTDQEIRDLLAYLQSRK